ncbi:protein of unknown function [Cupriavidus neocaledonicus]|uniref:Uncharacterized protein n=1 Tax=Cupriavidus neocaledonicus TaxID=1040979 RepID=A0A375H3M3_9BURK|nr:hypothetical protein CBM2605_A60157 [Cupriavidus neocaledonicus]SPD45488.1 protein of unknown function [Cupriavidus neocaledonicus]
MNSLPVGSPLPLVGEGQGVRAGAGMPQDFTIAGARSHPRPSPARGRGEQTCGVLERIKHSNPNKDLHASNPQLPPLRNRWRRTGLDGRPRPPDPGRA